MHIRTSQVSKRLIGDTRLYHSVYAETVFTDEGLVEAA